MQRVKFNDVHTGINLGVVVAVHTDNMERRLACSGV